MTRRSNHFAGYWQDRGRREAGVPARLQPQTLLRPHPGTNCIKIALPGKSILGDYFQENVTSRRPSGKTYFYTIASCSAGPTSPPSGRPSPPSRRSFRRRWSRPGALQISRQTPVRILSGRRRRRGRQLRYRSSSSKLIEFFFHFLAD